MEFMNFGDANLQEFVGAVYIIDIEFRSYL